MADETHYSSPNDSAPLKRKYEDQSSDRPTGFSAGPATGIELAKQRAQEVAARLLSVAPPPPLDAKRPKSDNGAPTSGFDSYVSYSHQGTSKKIDIPNGRVGVIIGKSGETIKYLQLQSGAKIQVTRDMDADPNSATRTVELMGTPEAIASAEKLINEVLAENRLRNPSMSGGYPQQGYQSRPPSNWGPPAPMQQPGYGYVQPGAYSGPSPQYNMPQPPYSGYPPQQPGGYSTNWDQSSAPPHQQSTHAGGYDYYSQQPQQPQNPGGPAPPADGSAYNYSQPPSSAYSQPGQGYTQDSYNAYNAQSHSGYGQPPTYDQQQSYGSVTGYGSGNNPAQEGHTSGYASQGDSAPAPSTQPIAQQGYPTSQQPSSNTSNYPPQGTPQSGYGVPPTSQAAYGSQPQPGYGPGYGAPQSQKPSGNPPVYGQSQSPSAVGGYGQSAYPAQPPPSGYTQPQAETGAQRAPPSGYGAGQPGYGSQTYGAPQGGQPAYGQAPPPYSNSSYGAGYTQAPAYTGDGNGSGNTQPPQTTAAKTSPQT
ncbi:hypothetical protein V8G54_007971 [Vigna mungo]|uniref:K Homology domain-containing protein n=1 Tax=Vigna mungo TaxID=3915 RepID=A0AAQ3S5Z2_VIGMU